MIYTLLNQLTALLFPTIYATRFGWEGKHIVNLGFREDTTECNFLLILGSPVILVSSRSIRSRRSTFLLISFALGDKDIQTTDEEMNRSLGMKLNEKGTGEGL